MIRSRHTPFLGRSACIDSKRFADCRWYSSSSRCEESGCWEVSHKSSVFTDTMFGSSAKWFLHPQNGWLVYWFIRVEIHPNCSSFLTSHHAKPTIGDRNHLDSKWFFSAQDGLWFHLRIPKCLIINTRLYKYQSVFCGILQSIDW